MLGVFQVKLVLDSSHHYEDAVKHFETHGIEIPGEIKINLEKMIGRKQAVVDQTTGGIDFLMTKNKIDVYHGMGAFKDATHITISGDLTKKLKLNIASLQPEVSQRPCHLQRLIKNVSSLLRKP